MDIFGQTFHTDKKMRKKIPHFLIPKNGFYRKMDFTGVVIAFNSSKITCFLKKIVSVQKS